MSNIHVCCWTPNSLKRVANEQFPLSLSLFILIFSFAFTFSFDCLIFSFSKHFGVKILLFTFGTVETFDAKAKHQNISQKFTKLRFYWKPSLQNILSFCHFAHFFCAFPKSHLSNWKTHSIFHCHWRLMSSYWHFLMRSIDRHWEWYYLFFLLMPIAAECFKQIFVFIFAMKFVWKCSGLFPIRWHRSIFSNVFLMSVALNNLFWIDFVSYLFFDALEMDYLALKIVHFCNIYMNEDRAGQGTFFSYSSTL